MVDFVSLFGVLRGPTPHGCRSRLRGVGVKAHISSFATPLAWRVRTRARVSFPLPGFVCTLRTTVSGGGDGLCAGRTRLAPTGRTGLSACRVRFNQGFAFASASTPSACWGAGPARSGLLGGQCERGLARALLDHFFADIDDIDSALVVGRAGPRARSPLCVVVATRRLDGLTLLVATPHCAPLGFPIVGLRRVGSGGVWAPHVVIVAWVRGGYGPRTAIHHVRAGGVQAGRF